MIIRIPEDAVDPSTRYYEQAVLPHKKERTNIKPLEEGKCNFDIDLFGKEVVNGYHSVYNLSYDVKKHIDSTGSIRNYCGRVSTEYLHWDIDAENDMQKAYDDTAELLFRLDSMGADSGAITVCLSGNKGFHVLYHTEDIGDLGARSDLHNVVKKICTDIAEGIDSFDEVVYDRTRLIRALNSKHPKSHRYKIPLTVSEFHSMSPEEIVEMAKEQREGWDTMADRGIEYIAELAADIIENQSDKKDYSRQYTSNSLLEGMLNGFPAGETNRGLTSIAGMYHRRGMDDDFVKVQLLIYNERCERPLSEADIDTIVRSVSKYEIDDKYVIPDNDEIVTAKQCLERFRVNNKNRKEISTDLSMVDPILSQMGVGQVMLIIARPGVGKTLLGVKLCRNYAVALTGKMLFISLEMDRSAVGFRFGQCIMSTKNPDLAKDQIQFNKEVAHQIINNDDFIVETADYWDSVLTVDKTLRSIEAIISYYHKAQELSDEKIEVVAIDYMQLMSGTGDRKELDLIARGLKTLGKQLQCRVVALAQVNRGAGSSYVKPELENIKEMGSLEDSCDICLSMWNDTVQEHRIHVEAVKGREGLKGYRFDLLQRGTAYKTVSFHEPEPEQKSEWGR